MIFLYAKEVKLQDVVFGILKWKYIIRMLYIEYERDIQKISPKCGKLILDYKNKNLHNNQ